MASPVRPSPSIPKDVLEKLTGCPVLTYLIQEGSEPGDGYMSIVYAVTAELVVQKGSGESEKELHHFIFKCFPRNPARQVYLCKTNMFHNELCFYRDWVKALHDFQIDVLGLSEDEVVKPAFPEFIGGEAIDYSEIKEETIQSTVYKPLENFIVMTNLKACGFVMADKVAGLDVDHLSLVLTELAKIHALGWAYKSKVEENVTNTFPFLKLGLSPSDIEFWSNIVKNNAEVAAKAIEGRLGENNEISRSVREFKEKVLDLINLFLYGKGEKESWKFHRRAPKDMIEEGITDEPWRVQINGDVWNNNIFFKYNEASGKPESAILFDFQITRESCPTIELVYLIYTATTGKFRASHLDTLLQLYCDKFTEFCEHLRVPSLPGFSFDSFKRRFHRVKPIGFMMAVTSFPQLLMDNDKQVNLEKPQEGKNLQEMFTEAFSSGGDSSLYTERILETAQDLYDQGVI